MYTSHREGSTDKIGAYIGGNKGSKYSIYGFDYVSFPPPRVPIKKYKKLSMLEEKNQETTRTS